MNFKIVFLAYLTVTLGFSVLFRYGFYYSFNLDTGYFGPFLLFHAFAIILPNRVRITNENKSV